MFRFLNIRLLAKNARPRDCVGLTLGPVWIAGRDVRMAQLAVSALLIRRYALSLRFAVDPPQAVANDSRTPQTGRPEGIGVRGMEYALLTGAAFCRSGSRVMFAVKRSMSPKRIARRRGLRLRKPTRRGFQTVEVIVVLPIVLIATLAVFEYGIAMVVEQAITHAATVAAREAGKGATMDQIESDVNAVLAPHNLEVGEFVSFIVEDLEANEPVDQRGTLTCDAPTAPAIEIDDVRVTVCVDLSAQPFLNGLQAYGLDFAGKTFSVSALVRKEISL